LITIILASIFIIVLCFVFQKFCVHLRSCHLTVSWSKIRHQGAMSSVLWCSFLVAKNISLSENPAWCAQKMALGHTPRHTVSMHTLFDSDKSLLFTFCLMRYVESIRDVFWSSNPLLSTHLFHHMKQYFVHKNNVTGQNIYHNNRIKLLLFCIKVYSHKPFEVGSYYLPLILNCFQ